MSETKSKKLRVYKLASEYNLSAENLVEFLQKKGHDVKNHMSMLSDEMIKDISDHFKKDIEKAEKHYKKIAEFQKKRSEKAEEEQKVKTVTEETTAEPIPPKVDKELVKFDKMDHPPSEKIIAEPVSVSPKTEEVTQKEGVRVSKEEEPDKRKSAKGGYFWRCMKK